MNKDIFIVILITNQVLYLLIMKIQPSKKKNS